MSIAEQLSPSQGRERNLGPIPCRLSPSSKLFLHWFQDLIPHRLFYPINAASFVVVVVVVVVAVVVVVVVVIVMFVFAIAVVVVVIVVVVIDVVIVVVVVVVVVIIVVVVVVVVVDSLVSVFVTRTTKSLILR